MLNPNQPGRRRASAIGTMLLNPVSREQLEKGIRGRRVSVKGSYVSKMEKEYRKEKKKCIGYIYLKFLGLQNNIFIMNNYDLEPKNVQLMQEILYTTEICIRCCLNVKRNSVNLTINKNLLVKEIIEFSMATKTYNFMNKHHYYEINLLSLKSIL